jgi:preprotein translocase subunit YajC
MLTALTRFVQETAATPAASTPATGDPATTPPSGSGGLFGGGLLQFLPMVAIFAIFYFVMIGPERKARKKREAMLKEMKKGDKVLTTSGMFGTIWAMKDNEITLQLDEGVRVRFSRQAIQEVLPDGSSSAPAKS